MRSIQTLICFLFIILFLAGCSTGGMSGGDSHYESYKYKDRNPDNTLEYEQDHTHYFTSRTADNVINDQTTRHMIEEQLFADNAPTKDSQISVAVMHQDALLIGQVKTRELKRIAGEIASQTPNIKKVYNMITVGSDISAMTQTADTFITGYIKVRLFKYIRTCHCKFKIVTEDGEVYVLGIASREEEKEAIKIIRKSPGVKKVYTMIQYKGPRNERSAYDDRFKIEKSPVDETAPSFEGESNNAVYNHKG